MSTLKVTVKQKTTKQATGFEGTVTLPGLKTTKLARGDGQTIFATTTALKTVARNVAKRVGATVEYDEPVRKAAKQSIKTRTQPKTKKTATKPKTRSTTKPKAKKTAAKSKTCSTTKPKATRSTTKPKAKKTATKRTRRSR